VARFEGVEPLLYGDPIAVVVQALLHAMRDEVELGKALVITWRTEGPAGLKPSHFEAVAAIVGVELSEGNALVEVNASVDAWLLKGENRHIPASLVPIYERYSVEQNFEDPFGLTMMGLLDSVGIRGHNRLLNDLSIDYEQRHVRMCERSLELLDATLQKLGSISEEEAASVSCLRWFMQDKVNDFPFFYHSYGLDQMRGMHLVLYMLMSETPVKTLGDGWNFVQRLKALPNWARNISENISKQKSMGMIPPTFVLKTVGEQLDNILHGDTGVKKAPKASPAYGMLMGKLTDTEKGAGLPDVPEDIRAALEAAISNEVAGAFETMRAAWRTFEDAAAAPGFQDHAGVAALPNGAAYYASQLAKMTTTTLTPEEVHQLGLDQVKEIMAELDEVMARLAVKDETLRGEANNVTKVQELRKQQRWLYPFTEDDKGVRTFPQESKDACLKDYRQMVDDIDKLIDPLFDMRPAVPCKVEFVPPHREKGSPAAYYHPGTFDGSRVGTFFVNCGDMMAQWKSFMRVLMAHEGIPGHHFQVTLNQEMKGLPFCRRSLGGFTAFVEGWALYTETLARDLGYFKTEEDGTEGYDLLGYFAANLLRAARCVVDTGLHYYGWSKEQAVEYMTANTFEEPGSIQIEVDRYCVMPGQATSYKIGALRFLALRDELKKEQGEAFDIVQFHRKVLSAGAMPLSMLPDVVRAEAKAPTKSARTTLKNVLEKTHEEAALPAALQEVASAFREKEGAATTAEAAAPAAEPAAAAAAPAAAAAVQAEEKKEPEAPVKKSTSKGSRKSRKSNK